MHAPEHAVGRLLFPGFTGTEPPDYLLEWLAAGRAGGVVLFERNIASPAQVRDLTSALQAAAPHPILIAIDQEGGRVTRLRSGFTESPGAMALGAAASESLAVRVAEVLAREMRAVGINWNLAPVADLTHDQPNPAIGVRSPGHNPQRATAIALAQVRGYQQAGVAATLKHFPGHGRTSIDTHLQLATVNESVEALWDTDLYPYREAIAAGVASIMISHVSLRALDTDYPATLSPAVVTGLLRQRLGYDGLICTDDMEMHAISHHYAPGEAAVRAALAGNDVIFFAHERATQAAAYDGLEAAVTSGRLPADQVATSVARIDALARAYPVADPPPLSLLRYADHLDTVREAARAGMVCQRHDPALLPLPDPARVALVEFGSYRDHDGLRQGQPTAFARLLTARRPDITTLGLNALDISADAHARARQLAASADVLVLATRNAYAIPEELALARELIQTARRVVLLCLIDPFDADHLPGVAAVLSTCGDSDPSLEAAVAALAGDFTPTARLP